MHDWVLAQFIPTRLRLLLGDQDAAACFVLAVILDVFVDLWNTPVRFVEVVRVESLIDWNCLS